MAASRHQVIHRVGTLQPEDQIVLVLVASGHRDAAFAAAQFIMDYLKTRAVMEEEASTEVAGGSSPLNKIKNDQINGARSLVKYTGSAPSD